MGVVFQTKRLYRRCDFVETKAASNTETRQTASIFNNLLSVLIIAGFDISTFLCRTRHDSRNSSVRQGGYST